jgi:hypothetical protein
MRCTQELPVSIAVNENGQAAWHATAGSNASFWRGCLKRPRIPVGPTGYHSRWMKMERLGYRGSLAQPTWWNPYFRKVPLRRKIA